MPFLNFSDAAFLDPQAADYFGAQCGTGDPFVRQAQGVIKASGQSEKAGIVLGRGWIRISPIRQRAQVSRIRRQRDRWMDAWIRDAVALTSVWFDMVMPWAAENNGSARGRER